jgi:hypothetical protein
MTEAEWLGGTDPDRMLEYLSGKPPAAGGLLAWLGLRGEPEAQPEPPRVSERKLRLYACACCRRVGGLVTDERSERAVETSERFADGLAGPEEMRSAEAGAWEALTSFLVKGRVAPELSGVVGKAPFGGLRPRAYAARAALEAARGQTAAAVEAAVRAAQEAATEWEDVAWGMTTLGPVVRAGLLRDLVGNPFRPASLDPAWLEWRGGTVRRIAQTIHDEYRFDELPVLADALEEAGCTDADILAHCRAGGDHVRGCWLVDLLLARR